MQMPRRNAHVRTSCGVAHLCERATARKGVANEPVAAMMNRQRAEAVAIQNLAGGADVLR